MKDRKIMLIITDVESERDIKASARLGFCREWTRAVILFVRNNFPEITIEAREVDITPNLQHTFVRLFGEDEESVIYDGVGTLNHPPFFGPESMAPKHLQNSKLDMINRYL